MFLILVVHVTPSWSYKESKLMQVQTTQWRFLTHVPSDTDGKLNESECKITIPRSDPTSALVSTTCWVKL